MRIRMDFQRVILAGVLSTALFFGAMAPAPLAANGANETPTKDEMALLKATSKAFAHVAKIAIPAVVVIKVRGSSVERDAQQAAPLDYFRNEFFRQFFGQPLTPLDSNRVIAQGSGFLVSSDGYILTGNHIVANGSRLEVTLNDGHEFDAEIVGTDPETDLAVIKIDAKGLPFLTLGNSNDLSVGEWVVAIGSPFGLEATLTVGVVSAKGRNQLQITDFDDFIQTDAAINPGNSGGPLLNLDGEVVGINTAILTESGGYMGIGFAIPSSMASDVMDQLINRGSVTRGYLGIGLQPVTGELANALNIAKLQGALVNQVKSNSPGSKAGLQRGDVIVAIDGRIVETPTSLRNVISMMPPGKKIRLSVNREGQKLDLDAVVGTHPEAGESSPLERKLGLEIGPLTDKKREELGLSGEDGVLVVGVKADSPAARAHITPGSVILEVNRQAITSPAEFAAALESAKRDGRHAILLVQHGTVHRYVPLKLPG